MFGTFFLTDNGETNPATEAHAARGGFGTMAAGEFVKHACADPESKV